MEVNIRPSEYYSTGPFTVKIAYNETVENLLVMISLSVTTVPLSEFQLSFNGRILKNKSATLDSVGIRHGDTVSLENKTNKCCEVF